MAARKSRGPDPLAAFDLMLPARSWASWRVFVKAIFALPMDGRELQLYRDCTGRTNAPTERARRIVGLIGRRGGKSRVIAWLASFLAAFVDYSKVLAPGEVGVIAVMAPSKAQAGIIKGYIEGFFDGAPALQQMVTRRTTDALDLAGQGGTLIRILVVSANYKLSRGHTLVAFVGDESAFWETETTSASPDVEIYRAILPALATTGGPAVLISTPYAPTGLVYDLHDKHWGVDDGDTLIWRADSLTMNPLLDQRLIEQAYRDDPESAAAEYGARFRSDLRTLFSPEALQACVVAGRREVAPQAGVQYTRFVDTSGGSADSFALGIAHRDQFGLLVLDAVYEWRAPFDPAAVVRECVGVLRRYPGGPVRGDKYASEWVPAAFRAFNVVYEPVEQSKSELFLEVLPLINAQQAQLLDQPRMLGQFTGLQRRTTSSGRDSVDHRRGAADDVANAAAGALVLATHASGKLTLPPDFTTCNRMESGLPSLGGGVCYLFGGRARPPADVVCRNCIGNAFVRMAREAHVKETGQGIDLLAFFDTFIELPEKWGWQRLREDAAEAWQL